jgi:hypothetical protein
MGPPCCGSLARLAASSRSSLFTAISHGIAPLMFGSFFAVSARWSWSRLGRPIAPVEDPGAPTGRTMGGPWSVPRLPLSLAHRSTSCWPTSPARWLPTAPSCPRTSTRPSSGRSPSCAPTAGSSRCWRPASPRTWPRCCTSSSTTSTRTMCAPQRPPRNTAAGWPNAASPGCAAARLSHRLDPIPTLVPARTRPANRRRLDHQRRRAAHRRDHGRLHRSGVGGARGRGGPRPSPRRAPPAG